MDPPNDTLIINNTNDKVAMFGILPQNLNKAFHTVCNPLVVMLMFMAVHSIWKRQGNSTSQLGDIGNERHPKLHWFKITLNVCMIYILSTHGTNIHNEYNTVLDSQTFDSYVLFSFLWSSAGSYILVTSLIFLETVQVFNTANALFVFWCATLASLVTQLLTKDITDTSTNALDVVHLCFVVLQCCLFFFSKVAQKQKPETPPDKKYIHPQQKASWISDSLLFWTLDVIWIGSKRTLKEADIPPLDKTDRCSTSISKFERFWKIENYKQVLRQELKLRENENIECTERLTKKRKNSLQPKNPDAKSEKDLEHPHVSLIKILIQTFGFKYFILQITKGLLELSHFVGPVLLGQFVIYVQNRDTMHWTWGLRIILTIFAFNTFKTIANHRAHCAISHYQKRIRSTLILAIVKKSLTMKHESAKDLTTGEIVSLIAQDCARITSMGHRFFILMSCPLTVMLSMYLLFVQVGEAMYVGLLIMIITIPINKLIGKKLRQLHTTIFESSSIQTKIINEIVSGIQVWKLYAWEPFFITRIHDICKEEEKINSSLSVVDAAASSMFKTIPYLVKLTAFGTYLFLGGHIDAATAFTSMHLFQLLNNPLSHLAIHIPAFVEASIGLKRIGKFLNGEDISCNTSSRRQNGDSAVNVENGMFAWERYKNDNRKPTLRNVNITIPKGGLVAVVGMVGAGKSSLLSAILGEMEILEGEVEVQGHTAYVPQEAWILNTSVQENILFGSKRETQRYQKVLKACALKKDIKGMVAGDLTEIGEKGINLSGGQRQRMSLARAVYNDADIYLLDDPLSAVDAHVGKHIFQEVIGHNGLLKDKTRIMVTHGIHWLPFVDSIIMVKDAQITEMGSYEELTSFNNDFVQFAKQALSSSSDTTTSPAINKVRQQVFTRLNSLNEEIISPVIKNYTENPFFKEILREETLEKSSTSNSDSEDENDNKNRYAGTKDDFQHFSHNQEGSTNNVKNGTYTDEETVEEGQVKKEIYLEYLQAVGYRLVALFCLLYSTSMICGLASTHIVKQWTDDSLLRNVSLSKTDEYIHTKWQYFGQFAVTGFFQVVLAFVFVTVITRGAFRAATKLHHKLLYRVLRCPISFFNTTPSSRIICRFSNDINRVIGLGRFLRETITHLSTLCTDLISLVIYCPLLCFTLLPVALSQFLVYVLHSGCLRQIKRFHSNHKPPMYSHFSELLIGRESIRAYKSQERFIKNMEDKIDTFNNIDLWELLIHIGLSMRFILLNRILELTTCLVCILNGSMTAGTIGLIMMYSGIFTESMTGFLTLLMDLELQMESLEKVIDYSNKPSEAPWDIDGENIPSNWPSEGTVVFNNYKAKHQENSDLALKGITCHIKKGEKIGIVGRTGAGKTTLAMALFRLFEASDGSISIDGDNIANLGLHTLRRRINILPQEPVIFKGSLRMNLDPFEKCIESELWQALAHAHLASFIKGLPNQLDFECEEGGKNLSMGQRQLLCLARTLLKKTKILVLDEATAAVDIETDELIQKTIATEFKDCTVLTIAHRLNTIIDYDKILVLEQGLVKEFDSPKILMKDKNSLFYSLAKDAKLIA